MSGRKQHYIPQCLLKGFETRSRGKTKKVWVFKKGQPPFISPTQDVATQRHFYSELSKDEALTLDDRITQYESELVPVHKSRFSLATGRAYLVDGALFPRTVLHNHINSPGSGIFS